MREARERQDEPHPPGGHCGDSCPLLACGGCPFQPKEIRP